MRARHRGNGSYVSADEAVLRRLGPEWEIEQPESEKKATPRKATPRKASGSRSDDKK